MKSELVFGYTTILTNNKIFHVHLRTNLENTDIECQRGGGQPWFLIFWHYITFNWHNFFVFHWNWNSLKWSVQHGRNWHPADFWTFRPPHRPEISVCQKKCIFPPLGHLPSPFIFFDNGLAKKKIFFLFKVWTYVFGKHTT